MPFDERNRSIASSSGREMAVIHTLKLMTPIVRPSRSMGFASRRANSVGRLPNFTGCPASGVRAIWRAVVAPVPSRNAELGDVPVRPRSSAVPSAQSTEVLQVIARAVRQGADGGASHPPIADDAVSTHPGFTPAALPVPSRRRA